VFRRWQSHAHNERDISQRLKSGNVPPVAQEVEVVAAAEPDFRPIPNVTGKNENDFL
jgi:hypothetical protein